MSEIDEPILLRKYLLGTLEGEVVRSRIEERLMVDDEYLVRVGAAEDELIEEFLDGEMTRDESDRFNRFFLAPPERKRQLRLTRDLRLASTAKAVAIQQRDRDRSDGIFSSGWFRFAAVAAVVVIAVLGVWRFAIDMSDTERGLDALRAAYRDRRPVESRITSLPNHAPYSETRGLGDSKVTDAAALDRANRYLVDASGNASDGAAHHAYAMYWLSLGEWEKAEREIKIALSALPNDAKIQSDAGALYLEKAGAADSTEDGAKHYVALDAAMKHFERAVELDSKLLEARFNLALALNLSRNTEQAKAAWREYLKLDSQSKWAEEAKYHLESLERQTPNELAADELESDFLVAFRAGDENEAARLVGNNRELIKDKYLPMRLAMSYLNASDDRRDELRQALRFVGEIEMKLTGDPFAKEIAHFYESAPREKWGQLADGHKAVREGAAMCLQQNYSGAIPVFEGARQTFDGAGDQLSARMAQYFAGYALQANSRKPEALVHMNEIAAWAGNHKYSWLEATALHWVASCQLDAKEVTKARRTYEQALQISRKIGDSYAAQRNLGALAHLHSMCGERDIALNYLFAAVKESDKPETSLRQRYRNIFFVFPILSQAKLYNAGKPAALEAVHMADTLKDQMYMVHGRAYAAMASALTGDLDGARALLEKSKDKASAIEAVETRDKVMAFANLRFADFERHVSNLQAAETLYQKAIEYYDRDTTAAYLREQAHRGALMTYLDGDKVDKLEEQIPVNIRLAEDYRVSITDEASKIGFYDLRANIYDIAAEFEFKRGNRERAYGHAESSSSRVLLERMQKSTDSPGQPTAILELAEIRAQMPPGVQLVQYSLFADKIVIWLITRDAFLAVPMPVKAKELGERVATFTEAISRESTAQSPEAVRTGRELYQFLIEPIRDQLDPQKELCLVPSGMLFDIPFAALSDADGKRLVETFRLIHAPSANVFIRSTKTAASRAAVESETVLSVGNPEFQLDKFPGLPRLPDSENEARFVSRIYPAGKNLIRNEATRDAFLSAVATADVVHFAGHYVVMPGTPMSSYLLFAADGDDPSKSELSNRELNGLSLERTRLMVLAACDSGVESYYAGEGMVGMSRTMLAAQVPLVVASQWRVDSSATADLMTRFHALREQQNLSTTAALRQAQLDSLNDPSGKFSSPYYWAAFAVYGGHADF